jgi:hypothetical protein
VLSLASRQLAVPLGIEEVETAILAADFASCNEAAEATWIFDTSRM